MTNKIALIAVVGMIMSANAYGFAYSSGPWDLRLTGHGTAGFIEPDFENPDFLGDWYVRAQAAYSVSAGNTIGAVYSIDAMAVDDRDWMHDAFLYYQARRIGRIEVGITDSVARKLSVGLPDVGGMRINDRPLFYKKIHPQYGVIGDTSVTSGRRALRINAVSNSTGSAQYGVSLAGLTDDYDVALDVGMKIRRPSGKVKTAISLGASLIENPENYSTDTYIAPLTADWRAQTAIGFNLQYNSWVWGLDARAIYDRNPIGSVSSDGISLGSGVSYDFLKYSLSVSYVLSETGLWDGDIKNRDIHTGLASFRYKYSEYTNLWISLGITSDTPFVACAMRVSF